ncbi:uncharacterized protein CC84DRAFT_1161787 [Paraphaeosphaeria sporulosa]|uniref:Uncharacterized protein n=1 Tax=Paraphaeosphaeria sporulosa TaxID=1460663 RepID=A0A177CTW5_9PLEO|nr:uncharacterized protein CC84DRAFT_1161787 [Paraphaeosphaeria sporulosa]OAG10985.1 hypothetical protein CC84DRAFT_1161787 [Paraphaeosphaeria sporulosa]
MSNGHGILAAWICSMLIASQAALQYICISDWIYTCRTTPSVAWLTTIYITIIAKISCYMLEQRARA